MLFLVALLVIGMGILILYGGFRQSTASMDELWESHERALKARGLAPQRSEEWEERARDRVVPGFLIGTLFLFFGCFLGYAAIQESIAMERYWNEPDGMVIDGRALSRREAENCHHGIMECLLKYPPDKK